MTIRRFDVEEVDRNQHQEVDEGEDNEDPERDCGDEIWDNLVDDAASD